jgi:hypothetical protein
VDLQAVVRTQIERQVTSDTKKFQYVLQTMDGNMMRVLPQSSDPAYRERAINQVVGGARSLVTTSQEYGFLQHRNYQPNNVPTPQSERIREALDSAWDKVTQGYRNNERALVEEGLA